MDPVIVFLSILGSFILGLFVGFKVKERLVWDSIKEGRFDPYKWEGAVKKGERDGE